MAVCTGGIHPRKICGIEAPRGLPYIVITGTRGPIRYGFQMGIDFIPFCLKQGIVARPCVYVNLQNLATNLIFTSLPTCRILKKEIL